MTLGRRVKLWSVTSLIKLALGTTAPLHHHAVNEVAKAAVHKRRTLDAMMAESGEDAAVEWLKRQQYVSSNAASDRGTEVHRAAESIALGQPYQIADELMPWVEQYAAWLVRHSPAFLAAEAPVYNLTWNYAGTLDGIADMYGRRWLYDIKTTAWGPLDVSDRGTPRRRPPFPEVALQCCAYAHAERIGVIADRHYSGGKRYYELDPDAPTEAMPKVDGALCVVVSPHDCFAVPVRIDAAVWEAWRSIMDVASFQLREGAGLFGDRLEGDASDLEAQLSASLAVT
jgi:hypothetical protein